MLNDILKNMNLFVDGRGYAGNVEELTPPKLTMKTEEIRNGGMDAPIEVEMGMDKLEASFTLTKYDSNVLSLFGLHPGVPVFLTFRGSVASENGTEKPVVIQMVGVIKEIDQGSWKAGDKATLKAMMTLRFYSHMVDGFMVHLIDIPNMVRMVNGVDQLLLTRKNLGM